MTLGFRTRIFLINSSTHFLSGLLGAAVIWSVAEAGIWITRADVPLILAAYAVVLSAVSALNASYSARSLRAIVLRLLGHVYESVDGRQPGPLGPEISHELGDFAGTIAKGIGQLDRRITEVTSVAERYRNVFDGMNVAVLTLNPEGRLLMINAEGLRLFGLSEKPLGKSLVEVVRSPVLKNLIPEVRTGRCVVAEFALTGPVERRIRAAVTKLPVTGDAVAVLNDVTELRRLETSQRDFVANVSHELRTPVSVIRANSETLLDGALDDPVTARNFLEAIVRNSDRLNELITDLLDLSKIESGTYRMEKQSVKLRAAVTRCLEALEKISRNQKQHRFVVDVPELLNGTADPGALDQVLLNLLDNAVKYTPECGTIRIGAAPYGSGVRVHVEDDGPGIEPQHRRRIFERFYRVDSGRTRSPGGTGLGLAIVAHLISALGGEVGVEGVEPQGSRFWFTLPPGESGAGEESLP